MSTLASTADLPSDEEADGDYIPSVRPSKKRRINRKETAKSGSDSDSDSNSSGSESDEGNEREDKDEVKRLKKEAEMVELEERRRKAKEAFAAFSDVGAPSGSMPEGMNGSAGSREGEEKMVQVERERKFAGEVIIETVSLPASHPEAIAFLAKQSTASIRTKQGDLFATVSPNGAVNTATPGNGALPSFGPAGPAKVESSTAGARTGISAPIAPIPAIAPTAKAQPRGPPKRKPRQSLEQMSASLGTGKKMTTLEKSQMDWKNHVASSSKVSDELDTNRRSGGFLEKRDFLDRVGDRRTETFDKKGARR